jgi:hypothetical protein
LKGRCRDGLGGKVTSYNADVIAWANEQASFIRSGRFDLLDIEHIADEIEDVGKSERRELRSRMAVLLAHLLKWQYQSDRHGSSWQKTIKTQRNEIAECLMETPSLKADIANADWWEKTWADTLTQVTRETGLSFDAFPESCPWNFEQIINPDFWPES